MENEVLDSSAIAKFADWLFKLPALVIFLFLCLVFVGWLYWGSVRNTERMYSDLEKQLRLKDSLLMVFYHSKLNNKNE